MTLQSAVWRVARLATWIFYRVDRVGDPLPAGPLLLVANHPNGLLDPPLIVATSGRQARFLAKSTLFSMPLVGWFVRGAGAIPVYRRSDAGVDASRNSEMFAAVERALAEGHAVCLFPEGTTHSRGKLDPLKTGAARIALGAAARGIPVHLVAAGINPDEKAVLRSNVTVAFGTPFTCDHLVPLFNADARAAVEALTAEIATHLRDLVIEAEPIGEGELVAKIDRIYRAARSLDEDAEERLARRQLIAEHLLPTLRRERPEVLRPSGRDGAPVRSPVDPLPADRGMVGGKVDPATIRRFAFRESAIVALLLPLLAVGVAAFAVPYFLIKGLSTRVLQHQPRGAGHVQGLRRRALLPGVDCRGGRRGRRLPRRRLGVVDGGRAAAAGRSHALRARARGVGARHGAGRTSRGSGCRRPPHARSSRSGTRSRRPWIGSRTS